MWVSLRLTELNDLDETVLWSQLSVSSYCSSGVACVPQLDYKVGWKKLKEVFGMAGVVVRTDILEDKDGKSRGMGTVTFDMPIEAVQAVCILSNMKRSVMFLLLVCFLWILFVHLNTIFLNYAQLCSTANCSSIASCTSNW